MEIRTESCVEMPVVINGKEHVYVLENLQLRVKGTKTVLINRTAFGPERAVEQALMSFPGISDRITSVHEGLFLIMLAVEVKRLEQDPSVDPRHPTLERLFRRLPAVYEYMHRSNIRLGSVLHINDRAA